MAKTPIKKPAQPKPASGAMNATAILRITSSAPNGHRRAGRQFGREPSDIPVAELSAREMDLLQDDPRLDIVVADAPAGKTVGPASKADGETASGSPAGAPLPADA